MSRLAPQTRARRIVFLTLIVLSPAAVGSGFLLWQQTVVRRMEETLSRYHGQSSRETTGALEHLSNLEIGLHDAVSSPSAGAGTVGRSTFQIAEFYLALMADNVDTLADAQRVWGSAEFASAHERVQAEWRLFADRMRRAALRDANAGEELRRLKTSLQLRLTQLRLLHLHASETLLSQLDETRNASTNRIVVLLGFLVLVGGLGTRQVLKSSDRLVEMEEQFQQAQRMEMVGRLAGGVSHDFNNILTVITGYSALIGEQAEAGSRLSQQVDAMARAVERGTLLTRQLLAFSRKQRLEVRVVNLNDLLGDILWVLGRTVGDDVILSSVLKSTWQIKADPAQLEQVIVNLATNARDAMPNGGELSIETSDVVYEGNETLGIQYRHRYRPDDMPWGSYVQLKVTDTGVGMDRDTLTHVFEPFFTTKDRGKGTGLGLPSVYGVISQAGGSVCVESKVGRGSSFYAYFPRTEEAAAGHAKVTRQESTALGRGTVLLVDDDEAVLALAEEILKKGGYTVLSAAKPQYAIDHYSEESIDLILTDVVMPEMSGPDFVTAWATRNSATSVLYMSGYVDESLQHHSIPEENFISKPFSPAELLQRVTQSVGSGNVRKS